MQGSTRASTPALLLVAGDLVCIGLFAVMGLRNHEEGITVANLVRAALPFQIGWLVFAMLFGLLREPPTRPGEAWRRVLEVWLPAWVTGLLLRLAIFDRSFAPTFATAALLVGWRTAAAYAIGRRR